MCITCGDPHHLSVMAQIRNMLEDLHRNIKSRAALAGMRKLIVLNASALAEVMLRRPDAAAVQAHATATRLTSPAPPCQDHQNGQSISQPYPASPD
jgi:Xaa-Pro aminopeptidase